MLLRLRGRQAHVLRRALVIHVDLEVHTCLRGGVSLRREEGERCAGDRHGSENGTDTQCEPPS
jgi:hypothetical protein